ncbi:MAG: hypothetical protein QXY78_05370 [Thermoplasmata archaeon]
MKQYDVDKLIELFIMRVGEKEKDEHIKSTKIRTALVKANKTSLLKRLGGVYNE